MVMNPYAFGAWQLQGAEPTSGYQMPGWGNMMANVGMGMLANASDNPAVALGKGWQSAQNSQNDYIRAQLLNDEMNQKREKRNQLNQLMKQYQNNPGVQQRLMIGDLQGAMDAAFPSAPSQTNDIKNYEYAIQHGLDPATFGRAGQGRRTSTVDANGRQLLVDMDTGEIVKDLGQSGQRNQAALPAELAARIGMTESFLKDLPGIRQNMQTMFGQDAGLVNRGMLATGSGDAGQMYRQVQSGVDALQRMLTGAGMNIQEAKQYADRYLPSSADTYETMTNKLDQLEKELTQVRETAMRGRGVENGPSVTPMENAAPSAPQPGHVEQGYRFKGGNPGDPNNWERVQ